MIGYEPFRFLSEEDRNTIEVVEPKEKTIKEKVGEGMIVISKIIMFNSLFSFACSPLGVLFVDSASILKWAVVSILLLIYGLCMYAVGQTIRNDD